MLFPVWQQREIATILREGILVLPPRSCIPGAELSEFRWAGGTSVSYFELDAMYGHDTFLIDLDNVGSAMKGFLEHPHAEHRSGDKPQDSNAALLDLHSD